MDILKNMLGGSQGADLLSTLTGAGFSAEQAEKFLPAASESVMQAASGMDLGGAGDMVNSLLQNIDIQSLADKVGLDPSMVTNGLTALLPQLIEMLKGDGLSSLLGGGGLGGLLGGLTGKK